MGAKITMGGFVLTGKIEFVLKVLNANPPIDMKTMTHLEKLTVSCKSELYCILSRVEDQNATCSEFINFFFSFFLFFNKTRNIFPVLQYLTQAPSGKNAW